jgi:hypothetical protein
MTPSVDLATLSLAALEPHLGERFELRLSADESRALELLALEPLSTPPGAQRGSFLARFRAREREVLPQQIYLLEHASLGGLELFLVPAGPDGVGMLYDAVFG